jgi:outer membrane lipoprotein SlyB
MKRKKGANMTASIRILSLASAATLAAALTGCAADPYGYNTNYPVSQGPAGAVYPSQQVGYVEYGRITNVALISSGNRQSNGNAAAGTVLGAVAGGLLGNQIGHGGGRAAATILGAVGGGALGTRIAGGGTPAYANEGGPVYRVSVRTDSGQLRTYDVSATGDLRPGDRVRIENGVIYLA